jgi:tRNA 2-thiocytidine biosynthesis protein TtcA
MGSVIMIAEQMRRKLTRRMMRTIKAYDLIEPNDRIMVGVSGGKDSYTLLELLWNVRKRSPFTFDIVAVHLDQGQPGCDGKPLEHWLANSQIPYEIVRQDTYSVVLQVTKPGGTYCAPCSRLRRGILYNTAERLNCNKVALGHHRDDTLETVMMNMFFAGKLQAMPPIYTTDDGRFKVIRPLIECGEADIIEYASAREFPILPCNLCGSQSGLQRVRMGELLTNLERDIPNVREVMLASLKNVRPTHLLDLTLSSSRAHQDKVAATDSGCDAGVSGAPGSQIVEIVG